MDRCVACGALLPEGSTWCSQCFAPVVTDEAPVRRPQSVVDVARVVPQYSRWRKSETSFGPVGRVLWTLGVIAIGLFTVFSANPFAMITWWFIGAPLVLRSVWARSRVT